MRLRQSFQKMEGFRSPASTQVAAFVGEVISLPGCPVVGVSHALYKIEGSAKGYGVAAFNMRANQMRELGYAIMLCTVRVDNAAQKAILKKVGADRVATFYNPQTNNDIELYVYRLLD